VLFVRNIDARGWKLHLRDPESSGNQTKYSSYGGSFNQVCTTGELDIVKAMVERTQVDLEARSRFGRTPLLMAAQRNNIPMVQYLCEQEADKEVRDEDDSTPLQLAAHHLPMVQYLKGL